MLFFCGLLPLAGNVIHHLTVIHCGSLLSAVAMLYSLVAWRAARRPIAAAADAPSSEPPATILKPLCGTEPETYASLRSFCDQRYPQFQIVFGVAEASDPVVAVVERLRQEFPALDLRLAIDRRQHGSNRKVSNLINMLPLASHEVLVLADSDICVAPDYLSNLVGPLADSGVGIVTCTYQGCPRTTFWSLMGSLFINDWFTPSVRVAASAGSRSFAFGATIAIRRAVLSSIGGFQSVADQLADDFRLGELTRRVGLRTVLSSVVVDTVVSEVTFRQLVRHELRWLRTIRAVNPLGHSLLFVTFSFPVAAIGCALAGGPRSAFGMLLVTIVARGLLFRATRRPDSSACQVLLLPVRDSLSLALWACSFIVRRVQWRESRLDVARDGTVQLLESA